MTDELKKCPFCGTDTRRNELSLVKYDDGKVSILCHNCGARGPIMFIETEETAIAAWNRRANNEI